MRCSTAGVTRAADRGRRQAEIGQTHDLALAHGNAAEDLGEIFAGADAHQQFLDLAETAGRHEPLGIGRKLPDRLDIGREPGKAVGGALFAIEDARHRATLDRHPVCDRTAGSANRASTATTAWRSVAISSWPAGMAGAASGMTAPMS